MASDEAKGAWPPPNSRMPTELERQQLSQLLFNALLEIRLLGWNGEAQQAADLADAFHNLPAYLWSEEFSIAVFRNFLEGYQERYGGKAHFNYLKLLDDIYPNDECPAS